MSDLQARLSEMLCDDSLKASAALQDFLGLQPPETLGFSSSMWPDGPELVHIQLAQDAQ